MNAKRVTRRRHRFQRTASAGTCFIAFISPMHFQLLHSSCSCNANDTLYRETKERSHTHVMTHEQKRERETLYFCRFVAVGVEVGPFATQKLKWIQYAHTDTHDKNSKDFFLSCQHTHNESTKWKHSATNRWKYKRRKNEIIISEIANCSGTLYSTRFYVNAHFSFICIIICRRRWACYLHVSNKHTDTHTGIKSACFSSASASLRCWSALHLTRLASVQVSLHVNQNLKQKNGKKIDFFLLVAPLIFVNKLRRTKFRRCIALAMFTYFLASPEQLIGDDVDRRA